jgi:hypothetical protein
MVRQDMGRMLMTTEGLGIKPCIKILMTVYVSLSGYGLDLTLEVVRFRPAFFTSNCSLGVRHHLRYLVPLDYLFMIYVPCRILCLEGSRSDVFVLPYTPHSIILFLVYFYIYCNLRTSTSAHV